MKVDESVVENSDGTLISLGKSLFNPGPNSVPACTVLGPYAGVLEDTEDLLRLAIRRQGEARAVSHTWDTAKRRAVDGFMSGNMLRYINTGKLPTSDAAVAENNVAAVRFGKNIWFYVTMREIKPREEYFISYGDKYSLPVLIKDETEQNT